MWHTIVAKIRKFFGWGHVQRPLNLYCGNCGERLTQRHFCRACGASEESGWTTPDLGEDSEDDFDYDDFVRREFGDGRSKQQGVAATTWGTIIIILLVVGLLVLQFAGLMW